MYYKYIMKTRGVLYTAVVLAILTGIVIYMTSNKPVTVTIKPDETKVTTAPEKQIVKPDDIVEEVIVGGSNDEVIGDQSDDYGPGMTDINKTFV
jgi:hypothetical protein